jgi:hypothetical protein
LILQYWVGDIFITVRNQKLTDFGGIAEMWATEGGLGGVSVLGRYEFSYGGEMETRVDSLLGDIIGVIRRVSAGVPAVVGSGSGWKMDVDTAVAHLEAHNARGLFSDTVERYAFIQATGAKAPAVVVGLFEGVDVRTVHERVRTYRERARGGTRGKRVSSRKGTSPFWHWGR